MELGNLVWKLNIFNNSGEGKAYFNLRPLASSNLVSDYAILPTQYSGDDCISTFNLDDLQSYLSLARFESFFKASAGAYI